jgi:hypothetical protein
MAINRRWLIQHAHQVDDARQQVIEIYPAITDHRLILHSPDQMYDGAPLTRC